MTEHRARCFHQTQRKMPQDCLRVSDFSFPSKWTFKDLWDWSHEEAVIYGDFNGDGRWEIGRVGASELRLLISRGDGTFHCPTFRFGRDFSHDEASWATRAIDINGDCKMDLMKVSSRQTVSFISQGDNAECFISDATAPDTCFRKVEQSFPYGWNFAREWAWNSKAAIQGDFNGDRKGDIARLGATYIHFFVGKGDGSFYSPVFHFPKGWNFGWNENVWTTLPPGDFDGDGRTDVIRTYSSYQHGFFPRFTSSADCWQTPLHGNMNSECIRITTFKYPVPGGISFHAQSVMVADFDADGKDDVQVLGPVKGYQLFSL